MHPKYKWASILRAEGSCKCSNRILFAFSLNTYNIKWKIYLNSSFCSLKPRKIICTSCTIVVLLALHSYSYQEHTIYILSFTLGSELFFFSFWPLLVIRIQMSFVRSLLILLTLKWKNGVINNFLTQFYVLISIVALYYTNAYNSNAYVIFQQLHTSSSYITCSSARYRVYTITWKINGFLFEHWLETEITRWKYIFFHL